MSGSLTAGDIKLTPENRRRLSLALMAVLALYGISRMRNAAEGSVVDAVDLAIHETGHLVFGFFGEIIAAAGGTLFQLIVPAVFCAYFYRRRDRLGAAVCLWWVAQNCWNIAVYVADARAQELPLVGGGEHDWAFLLGELGLLRNDQGIARMWNALGFGLFVVAIFMGTRAALNPPSPLADEADTAETRWSARLRDLER